MTYNHEFMMLSHKQPIATNAAFLSYG